MLAIIGGDDSGVSDEEELDAGLPMSNLRQVSAGNYERKGGPQTDSIMQRFIRKVELVIANQATLSKEAFSGQTTKVFISYCWQTRKEAVHEMAQYLMQQKDFSVWIDMQSMGNSSDTFEAMAKGIDEADIVIVFFSSAYAASGNCRREIEYAANKNKEILPVRVQPGYRPDGWLLFIFKSQFRIDFCEGDKFHEVAIKICDHIRSTVSTPGIIVPTERGSAPVIARGTANFKSVGVPFFSRSKYFSRPEDEARILSQMKNIAENQDNGCLVVCGDGGVGKTTLVARLISDDKNHLCFVQECNFHRVIWVNCFDWRQSFDERAFIDKILALAKEMEADNDKAANFGSLQGIAGYYKRKNLQVAYVLDDMFNHRLLQTFLEKQNDACICFVVTRDAQTILETNFDSVQTVERVEEVTDAGIKEMLKTTFKLNKFLTDDQLLKLATLCCGLPLIASLIAARMNNCEDKSEVKSEYKVLTSPQYRISELRTQNRSFKTVSNLFTFSLDQIDASLRMLYYAFLFFNPAEPVSIFDLGIMWGFDLVEHLRCGLRGVCRAFEKRSLVRRVKRRVVDVEAENEQQEIDDSLEDRFLVHQMLYEAALAKARIDVNLPNLISDDEALLQLRMKIMTGTLISPETALDQNQLTLAVLLGALKFRRRALIDRIISKLDPPSLADLCMRKSGETNGMAFLHYFYAFNWEKQKQFKLFFGPDISANTSLRLVRKVVVKLRDADDRSLLWKVVTERQQSEKTLSCLLLDVMDESEKKDLILDHTLLAATLLPFHCEYSELKWERSILYDCDVDPLIRCTFNNDLPGVCQLLATDATYDHGKAMLTAARKGFLEIVMKLATNYPESIKAVDEMKSRPLFLAARNGHLAVLKYLYQLDPASAMAVDAEHATAVSYAAKNGQVECVKFLHQNAPESLKILDQSGHSILMVATVMGKMEVVKYLCEKCPDMMDVRDRDMNATATAFAGFSGHSEVLEYLYARTADVNDRATTLMLAAAHGQLKSVLFVLARNPDVAKIPSQNSSMRGATAIMVAAGNGHLNIVEALYNYSDLSITINENDTKLNVLHMAVTGGHLEVVQFLFYKNPELATTKVKSGPFQRSMADVAVSLGHRDVAQFFIDNNVQ